MSRMASGVHTDMEDTHCAIPKRIRLPNPPPIPTKRNLLIKAVTWNAVEFPAITSRTRACREAHFFFSSQRLATRARLSTILEHCTQSLPGRSGSISPDSTWLADYLANQLRNHRPRPRLIELSFATNKLRGSHQLCGQLSGDSIPI
jgi:hypothetical protein